MIRDNPNKRNRKVRIDKPTETTTNGKTSTTWALFGRAWVSIEPLAGREYWEAKGQSSNITHQIEGAWEEWENVTSDFRIVYDARTFHLTEPPQNVEEANIVARMLVFEEKR